MLSIKALNRLLFFNYHFNAFAQFQEASNLVLRTYFKIAYTYGVIAYLGRVRLKSFSASTIFD